jgi:oligoendopeptidase F
MAAHTNLAIMSTATDPALEAATWNLVPLVGGGGGAGVEELLHEARDRATVFAERHKGRLGELGSEGLADAMHELAAIHDLAGRAGSYAMLNFSLDTGDPARGALLQKTRELGAAIETQLLFFELEWNQLPDERAEQLLAGEGLDFCRHYLRNLRRYRPHQLTEPEERVATELDVTGASAFRRLFTEQVSALEVALPGDGDPTSLEEALSRLQHPDREVREQAATATTEALRPDVRSRAYVFNTLLADKATKDRLRSYPHWLASRNLANEASDESVEALIEAVVGRYELARRWYRLKAGLLGLDRLAYWDRMAPVSDTEEHIPYDEARDIVLDCYSRFSPELGGAAGGFFSNGYIDGPPRPGKRGGAFCSYTVPSQHPYVMLNYTSRPYDVLVMAHELGHGVHAALARPQGVFQFTTPLTMAETASIFGETIVLERLLERAPDAGERLSLLAGSLDGAVAAVFRQVAMNRFEHAIHTERREHGEMATERFAELWLETQADLLGDAVELHDDYGVWWSYIPHFVDTPGYVYAYAYGHLLALSVYRRYEEEGDGFVPAYLDLLRAGGSRPPEELGRIVGVDLTDPGFWSSGLDLIERQLEAAEGAAREAGRLDG